MMYLEATEALICGRAIGEYQARQKERSTAYFFDVFNRSVFSSLPRNPNSSTTELLITGRLWQEFEEFMSLTDLEKALLRASNFKEESRILKERKLVELKDSYSYFGPDLMLAIWTGLSEGSEEVARERFIKAHGFPVEECVPAPPITRTGTDNVDEIERVCRDWTKNSENDEFLDMGKAFGQIHVQLEDMIHGIIRDWEDTRRSETWQPAAYADNALDENLELIGNWKLLEYGRHMIQWVKHWLYRYIEHDDVIRYTFTIVTLVNSTYGEALGLARDIDERNKRQQPFPRDLAIRENDTSKTIAESIEISESFIREERWSPSQAIHQICRAPEALTKELFRDDPSKKQKESIRSILSHKQKFGDDSEKRFATIALSLYELRNNAVHEDGRDNGSFQASQSEAIFFLMGVKSLILLSKRITSMRPSVD